MSKRRVLPDGTVIEHVPASEVGTRPRWWDHLGDSPPNDIVHLHGRAGLSDFAWVAASKSYADERKMRSIYIIGSMRNPRVPAIAKALRDAGFDVFDDWYSPGPDTDLHWQQYEQSRGRKFREALAGYHAEHAFALDKAHLERCDLAVLVAPAGKSGHLELGWVLGKGKPGYILMDGEPERYDLMYKFATGIFMSVDEMLEGLK